MYFQNTSYPGLLHYLQVVYTLLRYNLITSVFLNEIIFVLHREHNIDGCDSSEQQDAEQQQDAQDEIDRQIAEHPLPLHPMRLPLPPAPTSESENQEPPSSSQVPDLTHGSSGDVTPDSGPAYSPGEIIVDSSGDITPASPEMSEASTDVLDRTMELDRLFGERELSRHTDPRHSEEDVL